MAVRPFDVVEVVTMQLVLSDASVLGVTAELGFRAADPYTVRVEGDALLAAPAEPVERFVTTTQQLVPFGSESTRMDPEISRLIAALLTA